MPWCCGLEIGSCAGEGLECGCGERPDGGPLSGGEKNERFDRNEGKKRLNG